MSAAGPPQGAGPLGGAARSDARGDHMSVSTSTVATDSALEPHKPDRHSRLGFLTLAALGVVYGDIGTSPLYAFREAFTGAHALAPNETNVYATLSALFWAVMLIISAKYVGIVLRYDNEGEGGVLALMALAHRVAKRVGRGARYVMVVMEALLGPAVRGFLQTVRTR